MGDYCCRGSWRLGSACGQCHKCVAELCRLIAELTDSGACSYDHHGYCQTHNLDERPCPHERAKHTLTTARVRLSIELPCDFK